MRRASLTGKPRGRREPKCDCRRPVSSDDEARTDLGFRFHGGERLSGPMTLKSEARSRHQSEQKAASRFEAELASAKVDNLPAGRIKPKNKRRARHSP